MTLLRVHVTQTAQTDIAIKIYLIAVLWFNLTQSNNLQLPI